ncbi:hypothetical protein DFH28DRAFT_581134 [Melampsora americana]|nr:hypothetical protein DFH28DRAFT_581134 [Melampsora americana]
MPTLLKLTPSKPALPLTIPYSPSSTQTVQNLPSSTLPGLLTCTTTYPTPLSPSISSLDPSEEKSLKKSATIQQGDVAKSPDVQSSVLGKPFQEGPQKTTSTSVNDSTPPTLKHLHYHNKSSPGSINRSKGFFSRTLMSERPEEMTNILPESIELGTLFQTGSPHLCPPDRSPPTRKSPTKPLIMESNESVTKLSEALIELQSEKENGEGSMVKRPTRGSKISQRLEAMKKQTKRKAGRVESAIPIPNSEGPLTIFREPSRESKKDPSVKLMTLTKRFTSLNENRACVLKVEDWEMNKPRPTSPVSFSKSCRQYIKAHEDEDEDCGFEDSETIEKSESSRKVKWKKPLAEDVEIVGKLIKVPKKGILKKENQLDSDGNLIIESNMKILPEFVIVKRKVWSR